MALAKKSAAPKATPSATATATAATAAAAAVAVAAVVTEQDNANGADSGSAQPMAQTSNSHGRGSLWRCGVYFSFHISAAVYNSRLVKKRHKRGRERKSEGEGKRERTQRLH